MDAESRPLRLHSPQHELARLLRQRRAELSLTQAQVAKRIGVQPQTIGAWERGRSDRDRPQPRHWESIAEFLELDGPPAIAAVLEGREAQPVPTSPQAGVTTAAERVILRLSLGQMSDKEIELAHRALDALGAPRRF